MGVGPVLGLWVCELGLLVVRVIVKVVLWTAASHIPTAMITDAS